MGTNVPIFSRYISFDLNNMKIYAKPLLNCFCTAMALFAADVSADTAIISKAAENFIQHGATKTLRGCNLGDNRCGASPFEVIEKGEGESNDEKRTWRRMKLNGLEVTAIFPVAHPRGYYLEELIVSSSRWPVANGLLIGTPRNSITEAIGAPSNINEAGCSVYFSEEQQSGVTFCFANDRINKITWNWFID
jgi:hypothetical protein